MKTSRVLFTLLATVLLCGTQLADGARSGGGFGGRSSSGSRSSTPSYSRPSSRPSSSVRTPSYRPPSRPRPTPPRTPTPTYRTPSYRAPTYRAPSYQAPTPAPYPQPSPVVVVPVTTPATALGITPPVSRPAVPWLAVFLGLMLIGGVMWWLLRGRGNRTADPSLPFLTQSASAHLLGVHLLIGVPEAEALKQTLIQIAEVGDPDSTAGLRQMLEDAALATLRSRDAWQYRQIIAAHGTADGMDAQLASAAVLARAAFRDQTTAQYQGDGDKAAHVTREAIETPSADGLLAVLIAATWEGQAAPQTDDPATALSRLAGLSVDELKQVQVVWSPDQNGELIPPDEALLNYPTLQPC